MTYWVGDQSGKHQGLRNGSAGTGPVEVRLQVCHSLQYARYLDVVNGGLDYLIMPVMPLPARRFPSELVPDEAHVVQFYTHGGVLLDGLASSFGRALRAGESVIVVMTKAHEKGLRKRLKAQGINLEEAVEEGRFVAMDACKALDLFMDRGGPNRQKFLHEFGNVIRAAENAAAATNRRVAVFGEMVAVLWKQKQVEAAIRLEQLWNELAKTRYFFLHCAYPAKGMQGEPYHTICAEHAVVIPA